MKPRLMYPPEPPPPDDAPIIASLEQAGYRVTQDEKGILIRRLLPLLGGLERLDFLCDSAMLRLLMNAQIRKGRAFTAAELKGIAQPHENAPRFYEHIQTLLGDGAFFRGYLLKCPSCGLRRWYEIGYVNETTHCTGCHAIFQPPLELPFAYKPNELLIKGLKNGALTVLLTLRYFEQPDMRWYAGYTIRKDGRKTDIDLIIERDGRRYVVECKDNIKHADKLRGQLALLVSAAKSLDADEIYLATLMAEFPADLMGDFPSAKWLGRGILCEGGHKWF